LDIADTYLCLGFSRHRLPRVWPERLPRPSLFPPLQFATAPPQPRHRRQHEESKLRRGVSQNISGIGKWNSVAIGVRAIDVVKANGNLCHHSEISLSCFEHLSINRIAQSGDEPINTATDFLNDQLFRRRLRPWIHFQFVSPLA